MKATDDQIIEDRRNLHRYPETAWTEYRTTAYIWDRLEKMGYEIYAGNEVCEAGSRMGLPSDREQTLCEARALKEGVSEEKMRKMRGGFTGIVGVLKGPADQNKEKKVYALRFDIDAIPVCEKTDLEFSSVHAGIMHACGHDGHIAAGLAAAGILAENREKLPGEVRLIFQPAEEGCRGAKAIVDKGWLGDVDVFLSGHIGINADRLGYIAACTQGFLATSKLNFKFCGEAAHAAKTEEPGKNALLAAADFTVNAYGMERRDKENTRLNIGSLRAGTGRNVIAAEAFIEAETRGTTTALNEEMKNTLINEARKSAAKYGVSCNVEIVGDTETGSSSIELVEKLSALTALKSLSDIQYDKQGRFTASEDAVTMMNAVQKAGGKAAYFMFGSRLTAEHHASAFDFQEETMRIMADFLSSAVLTDIKENNL